MNFPGDLAGHLGQLTAFPQHDAGDHSSQGFQVPRQVPTRFFGVELPHGLFYGTMNLAAVTHGVAPVLW